MPDMNDEVNRESAPHIEDGPTMADVEAAAEREKQALELQKLEASIGLDWRALSSGPRGTSWATEKPPPRDWLLTDSDGAGYMPAGKVGMLAGAGGTGKSQALCQLALAIATGRPWLGRFKVNDPGRVLLALGEEDRADMDERLYYAAAVMGLSDDELAVAGELVTCLPMAAIDATLTRIDRATSLPADTPLTGLLLHKLAMHSDWRLLLIDPASQFAGPEAETNNAAATYFSKVLARLSKAAGSAGVLFAHHTTKSSRLNKGPSLASDARGSSGLTDAVRWQANLDPVLEKDGTPHSNLITLSRTKSNYSSSARATLPLWKDAEHGGAPRPLDLVWQGEYDTLIKSRETTTARTPKKTAANPFNGRAG